MKAVAIKDVKKLEVVEVEEPKADLENVLIAVKKSGICGSDIHNWDSGAPTDLVMGHEFSGVVIDPGSREDLEEGDRVTALPISPCGKCHACLKGNPQFCEHTWDNAVGLAVTNPGGYAPMLKVRPDMVIKLPNVVSFDEGAMVEPIAVSLHAIHLADIKVGDKVLVVGGGIIGLACAMFAKEEGASIVVLSETNDLRGKKGLSLNVCDKYLNPTNPKYQEEINKIVPEGFDVVIDAVGNSPAVSSALMAAKTGGTVVLVGVSSKPIEIPTVLAVLHELNVKGAIAYTKEEFETVIDLIAYNKIDAKKFIDDIVPLQRVQESFERLTSGKDEAIKILIDPNK